MSYRIHVLCVLVCLASFPAGAQSVVNRLVSPPKKAVVAPYSPVTPPAATPVPQIAPAMAKTMTELDFLPNESSEAYVARMTRRKEAALADMQRASTRHAQKMKEIRERFSTPTR